MILKRLFLSALLLTTVVMITGCSTVGPSKDPNKIQYRIAGDECIRRGHRRGTYDYNRCVAKRVESMKKDKIHERE
jgi:hypothetical protein